jgi:membrane associated rhomboid family serine protease
MWEEEHQPRWTYIFIAASIILYWVQRGTRIWFYLAFTPALTTTFPWTPITAIFLHIDLNHLFFNMLALLFLGTALERRINEKLFITIFVISGIVGNLGYYFTAANPMIPVLGASGAIYGVIGTLAVLEPFRLVYFYGLMPLPMIGAAILWALADLQGLFIPSRVAHGVHLVGMLVGVIAGLSSKVYTKSGYSKASTKHQVPHGLVA